MCCRVSAARIHASRRGCSTLRRACRCTLPHPAAAQPQRRHAQATCHAVSSASCATAAPHELPRPAAEASAGAEVSPATPTVGARLRVPLAMHGRSPREPARRASLTGAASGAIERDVMSPSFRRRSRRRSLHAEDRRVLPDHDVGVLRDRPVQGNPGVLAGPRDAVGGQRPHLGVPGRARPEGASAAAAHRALRARHRDRHGAAQPLRRRGRRGDPGPARGDGRGQARRAGPGQGGPCSNRLPHGLRNVGDGEAVVVSPNTPPVRSSPGLARRCHRRRSVPPCTSVACEMVGPSTATPFHCARHPRPAIETTRSGPRCSSASTIGLPSAYSPLKGWAG